ncbi:hypothetical protein PCASD_23935 [Puccinia coronata f. sp. avenae]|uniref:Uncharacterized protein n=1 Tax=Puccinia coronata f. sp. avenae TaxID=200324 RepID=A0A2N5S9W3_9BASI|nr:hypothetical protein PCASD_23935 [Puccinia coronata f. sp. avenae]
MIRKAPCDDPPVMNPNLVTSTIVTPVSHSSINPSRIMSFNPNCLKQLLEKVNIQHCPNACHATLAKLSSSYLTCTQTKQLTTKPSQTPGSSSKHPRIKSNKFATAGSTTDATAGSTGGATAGSSTGATAGSTAGATALSTAGAPSGSSAVTAASSTKAATAGSSAGAKAGLKEAQEVLQAQPCTSIDSSSRNQLQAQHAPLAASSSQSHLQNSPPLIAPTPNATNQPQPANLTTSSLQSQPQALSAPPQSLKPLTLHPQACKAKRGLS